MSRAVPLAFVAVLLLAACAEKHKAPVAAPLVERTLIATDPPVNAKCRVKGVHGWRDAAPAPLTIPTLRLGLPIVVTCEAPGHLPTTEILYQRPLPRMIDALLAGTKLSPMVDLVPAPGAGPDSRVPARMLVRLRRIAFEAPAPREAFYDRLKTERVARWQGLLAGAELECRVEPISQFGISAVSLPTLCAQAYRAIADQRDADLRALEIDRRRATIR
ncbi:MAG: hypothetical protein HQ481_04125 [Alphaproteobacteria bacterium]|nr:hypothetical protein [Alphaproteobacteria bacterium]